jgi:CDP-4-dehydro-6-deoxyglucose reductase
MARIVIQPSGKLVEWKKEDTALMALERAGYALPNNCRAGACGECKVKVLQGEFDQGMVLDMALTEDERKNGYGLMCMAKQISDEMEIEWLDAEARPKLFPPREGALFVLVDRRELTPRTLELHLRPVGKPIRYWPGQYVRLGDPRAGIPLRAYSIANAPQSTGEITLQIARAEGGVTSTWIAETLKPGDTVKVNGAYGAFIGDPSAETPVLCLAAGTGLAPVLDLSEAALRRGYRKNVEIIFSARTEADVYGRGMLAWWRTKHRNFDYKVTLTREQKEGFLHGRITELLPKLHPDLSGTSVFVAGGTAFVDNCMAVAKTLGAQAQLTHKEGFFEIQDLRNQGRPG